MIPPEWSTPATIIAIATLLGIGNLAPKVWDKLLMALTGNARRSREENDRLRRELAIARDELDAEAAHRRRLQEALSETRIVATQNGVPANQLPSYPSANPE